MVAAGQPSEIKDNAVCAFRRGDFVHVAVAHAKNFRAAGKTRGGKPRFCIVNGALLNIHGDNPAAFSHKRAQKFRVVTVARRGVNAKIAGLNHLFYHFVRNVKRAPFVRHKNPPKKSFVLFYP